MKDIERFIAGFRSFREDYFGPDCTHFRIFAEAPPLEEA
jgi:hypothetical protein